MASSVTQILGWLPGWGIVIGEWGSMGGQALANRVTHAHAYSRDTAVRWYVSCLVGQRGLRHWLVRHLRQNHWALRPSRPIVNANLSRERKRVCESRCLLNPRQPLTHGCLYVLRAWSCECKPPRRRWFDSPARERAIDHRPVTAAMTERATHEMRISAGGDSNPISCDSPDS